MTRDFYECSIQEWSYWYRSITSRALDSFKFWIFSVFSLAFSVQHPESSVQSPASRVQHPESSIQSPASRVQGSASRVQRPEYSVQHLCPKSRNSSKICCLHIVVPTVVKQWNTISAVTWRTSHEHTVTDTFCSRESSLALLVHEQLALQK